MEALTNAITTILGVIFDAGTAYVSWVMETPLVLAATALSFAGIGIAYARSAVRGQ